MHSGATAPAFSAGHALTGTCTAVFALGCKFFTRNRAVAIGVDLVKMLLCAGITVSFAKHAIAVHIEAGKHRAGSLFGLLAGVFHGACRCALFAGRGRLGHGHAACTKGNGSKGQDEGLTHVTLQ